MLLMLFAVELSASACTMLFLPPPIISPAADGVVPQGFGIRAEGGGVSPQAPRLLNEAGEAFDLIELDEGSWRAPDYLEPGTYQVDDFEVTVDTYSNVPQPDLPSLVLVEDDIERVSEAYTASCMNIQWRRHKMRTVVVDIPGTEGTGWAVQVTDANEGHLGWFGVDTVATEQSVTVDLGRVADASDEACITISLHSPAGEEVWSEDHPCETSTAGCSTLSAMASLPAALLALMGIGRRRR